MKKFLLFMVFIFVENSFAQMVNINSYNQIESSQALSAYKIIKDVDGNSIIIGTFTGTVDFDFSTNVFNVAAGTNASTYILKVSSTGVFIWVKTFDRILNINEVVSTTTNIYLAGSFSTTFDFDPSNGVLNKSVVVDSFSNTEDFFVAKYDLNLNPIWVQTSGSIATDEIKSFAVDALGNVHAVGYFRETTDFDPSNLNTIVSPAGSGGGKHDGFYWKLTSNGNFVKAFKIGGIFYDDIRKIIVDDTNILLMGLFSDTVDFDPQATVSNLVSGGGTDTYVLKLDLNHNFISSCKVGSDSVHMKLDSNGNILLVGRTGNSVNEDFDPSSATFFVPTSTFARIYVLKLTSTFNFAWVKTFGAGTGNQSELMDFEIDVDNNLYTLGRFKGTADFDPNAGVSNLVVMGSSNYQTFFQKMNSDGNFITAVAFATYSGEYAFLNDMVLGTSSVIELAGNFDGSFYISPNAFTTFLTSAGQQDALILRLNQTVLNNQTFSFLNNKIYPNPASSQINLSFESNLENANIKIISTLGQTVIEKQNLSGNNFNLDISNLSSGIYIIEINDGLSYVNSKFIKQ